MTVSDAALRAVTANAVRHLIEADQHYRAGRYPSATASAVLSIEEAGKLTYAVTQGSLPKEKRHAAHTMAFVALLKGLGQWNWIGEWTKVVHGGAAPADVDLTAQQQQDIASHPELEEFVRRAQTGELADSAERLSTWTAAVVAKEHRDGTNKPWELLFSQGLQIFRLRATYVDITPSGDVQDPSTFADESTAKFLCTGAVGFVVLAVMLTRHTHKGLELLDLLRGMPDDITGWDTLYTGLCKVFPSLAAQRRACSHESHGARPHG